MPYEKLESDTPRTDACDDVLRNVEGGPVTYVDVELARQLERELAQLKIITGEALKRIRELEASQSATAERTCPYCASDNKAIRDTYFDQTCEGCVRRMDKP